MPKKPRDKSKPKGPGRDKPDPTAPTAAGVLRRRRNRRLIFLGIIVLLFPVVELIAYRFRAITVTVANRTDGPVTRVKISYPGGAIEADEIKPGGSLTRVIAPRYSFSGKDFSTYPTTIRFSTASAIINETRKTGTLDYSAHETYSVQPGPPGSPVELKQTTSPGFPLSTIRELLAKMGIG